MFLLPSVCVAALSLALLLTLTAGTQGSLAVSVAGWMTASLFYLVSVWAFHQNKFLVSKRIVFALAILWRLLAFCFSPAFSDDLWRYHWEGALQAQGGNPYLSAPGSSASRIPMPEATAGYGPLLELLERANFTLAATFTPDALKQVFWMKLHSAVFDLGVLWLLAPLPTGRFVIYAWCPLPVLEFWWNGHNDAVLLFCLLAALQLATRNYWTLAYSALALASATKWWPALLLPAFFWHCPRVRAIVAFPITLALSAMPYLTTEVGPILENAHRMSGFLGGWRNNDSLFSLILFATGGNAPTAKWVAVILIITAALTFARLSLPTATLATTTVLLLLSANCHPWYLSWVIALLPFSGSVPKSGYISLKSSTDHSGVSGSVPYFLWIGLIPVCYIVLPEWWWGRVWNGSPPERWLVYGPVLAGFGLLLVGQWKSQHRFCHRRTL